MNAVNSYPRNFNIPIFNRISYDSKIGRLLKMLIFCGLKYIANVFIHIIFTFSVENLERANERGAEAVDKRKI
jgi:hypothetical protein